MPLIDPSMMGCRNCKKVTVWHRRHCIAQTTSPRLGTQVTATTILKNFNGIIRWVWLRYRCYLNPWLLFWDIKKTQRKHFHRLSSNWWKAKFAYHPTMTHTTLPTYWLWDCLSVSRKSTNTRQRSTNFQEYTVIAWDFLQFFYDSNQ